MLNVHPGIFDFWIGARLVTGQKRLFPEISLFAFLEVPVHAEMGGLLHEKHEEG